MKQIILLFIFLTLWFNSIAQNPETTLREASQNYNSLINYIDQHPEAIDNPGLKKRFARYESFWGHRADYEGSYAAYYRSLIKSIQNQDRSKNTRQVYTSLGPRHINTPDNIGRVSSIWINPDNLDHIKIGSASAGLWETINGGDNWTCLTPDLPGGVGEFIVHPDDPSIIYGILQVHINGFHNHKGDGYGIFKSTDGGSNAELLLPEIYSEHKGIYDICFKPGDPETVYALTSHSLYRINDSIVDEFPIIQPGEGSLVDLGFSDTYPNIGFAYSGIRLYRTTDGGQTWSDVSDQTPQDYRTQWTYDEWIYYRDTLNAIENSVYYPNSYYRNQMAVHGNHVYLHRGRVKFREDQQDTAVVIQTIKAPANTMNFEIMLELENNFDGLQYPFNLRFTKQNNPVVCLIGGMAEITDGNYSIIDPIHADMRDIEFFGTGADDFIAVTDGGVEYKCDHYINGDLALNEIHGHEVFMKKRDWAHVGTHDDGTFYYKDDSWHNKRNNEGAVGFQHQTDFGTYVDISGCTGNGRVNFCKNENSIHSQYISGASIGQDMFADPLDQDKVWIAQNYKGDQDKDSIRFIQFDVNSPQDGIQDVITYKKWFSSNFILRFGHQNPNVLVASSFAPWQIKRFHLRVSTDKGETWTKLEQNSEALDTIRDSGLRISDIEINPMDDNEIWITFSRFMEDGNIRVMHTTDFGNTWEDLTGDLPDIPVTQIEYHAPSGRLLIGTDIGLYEYNGNQSWTRHAGFPIVPVTKMIINDIYQDLTIGTYGRGLWRTNLSCATGNELVVSTNQVWGTHTNPCANITITNQATLTINGGLEMPPTSQITVDSGANLVLNDSLVMGAGAKLILKQGAQLTVNNNTTRLGPLTELETEDQVTIRVNGTGNLLVEGDYTFNPTDNLTVQGNGSINLYPRGNETQNINLQGINGQLTFEADSLNIGSVVFTAANIEFYPYSKVMFEATTLDITNSIIKGNEGYIKIKDPESLVFEDNNVEEGLNYCGLFLYSTQNEIFTLKRSSFNNSDIGLLTYGGGVKLEQCTFDGNVTGWKALNMTAYSRTLQNTFINNSDLAIYYDGYNDATLKIQDGTIIENNQDGIMIYGPLMVYIKCSYINNNGIGILVRDPLLHIYYSEVKNNTNAIQSFAGSIGNQELHLNCGYNNFVSTGLDIVGYYAHSGTLAAHFNKWKDRGLKPSPVYDIDYHTQTSSYPYPALYLKDDYPISEVPDCPDIMQPCVLPGPGSLGKGGSTTLLETANALYSEEKYEEAAQIYQNIILSANDNLDDGEWEILISAYRHYQSIAATINNIQTDDLINLQDHLLDIMKPDNYDDKLYLNVMKAQSLRLKGEFSESIYHFQQILNFVEEAQFERISELLCQVETDYQVLKGKILPTEIDTYKQQCMCEYEYSDKEVNNSESGAPGNNFISIHPNPAKNDFIINLKLPKNTQQAELYITDRKEQIKWHKKIKNDTEEISVNAKKILTPGLHFVVLRINGKRVDTKKLIIE